MAFYNLLGQTGPKGQTNPDAVQAGPYIYDSPPGRGDNKGLGQTSTPSVPVQSKSQPPTSNKIKELQRNLGVSADGIVGPITIGAAKDAIASSRSISEAVGLSKKYELILNIDKYKTATKTVSAPSQPPTRKEKITEAVDIFTTALFPPTAVAKALTGNQTIGPETRTSIDIAGEWVMIDREGFTIFKDKDVLRSNESAKEPRWYNTKTGRSISIVDKDGRPVLPEFSPGKPVDKSIINPTSLEYYPTFVTGFLFSISLKENPVTRLL